MEAIETEVFEQHGIELIISRKQINNNTYLVVAVPEKETKFKTLKRSCQVYALEGTCRRFPEYPSDVRRFDHELIIQKEQKQPFRESLETFVSQTINDAVCKFEDKLNHKQELRDKVEAALEANAEVHGGIDYELQK